MILESGVVKFDDLGGHFGNPGGGGGTLLTFGALWVTLGGTSCDLGVRCGQLG